jgi:hypothetical protein
VDLDELPRVTPALLRRADTMCRRRLAREHAGGKQYANRSGDARFAVSSRLVGDARLAHAEPGPPRVEAFVDPSELEPEQRQLYRAAVRGYLAVFGKQPGQAVDLGWRTSLPELGVDLVSNVGLAFEPLDGPPELRVVRVGGRPMDEVDLHVALVRTEEWAPDELRVLSVDVIQMDQREHELDVALARKAAHEWLTDRVAVLRRNAEHGAPRAGADCNGCPFIAGCGAHPQ